MVLTLFCYTFLMTKISDGYYYEAYDLGNGKVLKKKKSFMDIAKAIKGASNMSFVSNIYKTYSHIRYCEKVTRLVKNSTLPRQLLANPHFINTTDYEQDKVTLLMDYFASHTLEENRIIVDKYFDLIKEFLCHGIHDNVYKFKNSYGISNEGKVVCIDFNEMVFSKVKVLELAQTEEWRTQAQFTKFPEGELKDYLGAKFREVLTPTIINQYWDTYQKN